MPDDNATAPADATQQTDGATATATEPNAETVELKAKVEAQANDLKTLQAQLRDPEYVQGVLKPLLGGNKDEAPAKTVDEAGLDDMGPRETYNAAVEAMRQERQQEQRQAQQVLDERERVNRTLTDFAGKNSEYETYKKVMVGIADSNPELNPHVDEPTLTRLLQEAKDLVEGIAGPAAAKKRDTAQKTATEKPGSVSNVGLSQTPVGGSLDDELMILAKETSEKIGKAG